MPYQRHTRVRCNGVIGPVADPIEIFSYGFNLTEADFTAGNFAESVRAEVALYHGDAQTRISSSATLTEVAFSQVGEDGKQVGNTLRLETNTPGGGGQTSMPPQVALRVSLGTGDRGRSNRGGYYLPLPVCPVDYTTGLFSEANAEGIRVSTLALLAALKNLYGADGGMVIASSILGNKRVTQLRVGRALDTVRTRRNSLTESYPNVIAVPQ